MRQQHGSHRNSRHCHASQRSQHSHDSPPRLKHQRRGPVMSSERFMLMVGQLQSRMDDLWEQEQLELQRGIALRIISCGSSPPSPQHQPKATQQADHPASPGYPFGHSSLLQTHGSGLHSPSLISVAHQFNSPGGWGGDFDAAIAASLGFGPPPAADMAGKPADVGPSSLHMHASVDIDEGPHGQHPTADWPPLGVFHDVEAFVTLPPVPLLNSSGGGSATARAAKTRLIDRFDIGSGVGATTATGQLQSNSPFCGLSSCTPGVDDFLGSPQSWARGYL